MIQKSSENRPYLVLDTNVCLDLFVFRDPRWASLLAGLRTRKLQAITNASCRNEWLAVLHYKQLPITDENRPAITQAFDELIQCVNPDSTSKLKLPICSDPDDQQFMELARDAKATHLITKDKALLKCAKRVLHGHTFKIVSPEVFIHMINVELT